jgi:hypothetical protein
MGARHGSVSDNAMFEEKNEQRQEKKQVLRLRSSQVRAELRPG